MAGDLSVGRIGSLFADRALVDATDHHSCREVIDEIARFTAETAQLLCQRVKSIDSSVVILHEKPIDAIVRVLTELSQLSLAADPCTEQRKS